MLKGFSSPWLTNFRRTNHLLLLRTTQTSLRVSAAAVGLGLNLERGTRNTPFRVVRASVRPSGLARGTRPTTAGLLVAQRCGVRDPPGAHPGRRLFHFSALEPSGAVRDRPATFGPRKPPTRFWEGLSPNTSTGSASSAGEGRRHSPQWRHRGASGQSGRAPGIKGEPFHLTEASE
jgi:hypothetical protein